MKQINIPGRVSGYIKDCSKRFVVPGYSSGSGVVTLTRSGHYLLTVSGITETVAKRNRAYKDAVAEVTKEMVKAYAADELWYIAMYKRIPKIYPAEHYKRILEGMSPEKYVRRSFAFPKPERKDVLECLNDEAARRNLGKLPTDKNRVDENKLIEGNLETLYQKRMKLWQEACSLFDKIEDTREEKANAEFLSKHRKAYDEYEAFVTGEEDLVEERMVNMEKSLAVPYSLALAFDYKKKEGLIDVSVVVRSGLFVPKDKASTNLLTGRISIKSKSEKDMAAERALATLSMTYLLAGTIFDVSPNIRYVRLSLYDRTKQTALLWVEFDRERFSQTDAATVMPPSDILKYPNVVVFSKQDDCAQLQPMEEAQFNEQVAVKVKQANFRHALEQLSCSLEE